MDRCWLILFFCAAWVTSAAEPKTARVAVPPDFSIAGGVFASSFTVRLIGKSATVRYTLDGSNPDSKSPVYTGPLPVSGTTLIKAKGFDAGASPSPTVSQTYTVVEAALAGFSSDLPIVILHTFDEEITSDSPAPVSAVFIPPVKGRATLMGTADFNGRGVLKTRGHSSLEYPKNSFSFHTKDATGASLKVSLLALPKESDWVLYAPYPDKTLMRDVLAYELGGATGHYAPRTRFVELFINFNGGQLTRANYHGVYVLEEKIKRGKERVNIAKLEPTDAKEPNISGGYIFKKDHPKRGGPGFTTYQGNHFEYVEPKGEEITPAQKAWLTGYIDRFESALYGANFKDQALGYAAYIDAGSFIDYHWLVEFTKNIDGIRFSNFIHKDRGGKLKMEPPWDWNLSFGNATGREGYLPQGWYSTELSDREHLWFRRLFADPDFAQRYADRWGQLRTNQFELNRVLARVDQIAAQLHQAQARNFQRWPILGRRIPPNYHVGGTYENEVEWMKNWIRARHQWIDQQFIPAPLFQTSIKARQSLLALATSANDFAPPAVSKAPPPKPPARGFTTYLQAESGSLVPPMSVVEDDTASNGRYIATRVAKDGTASFTFKVPAATNYQLWARVLVTSTANNTFFYSVDGGAEDIYDAAENHYSTEWQWNRWSGRVNNFAAQNTQPKMFTLTAGTHTLLLRGREANTKLDRLCLTDDPALEPDNPDAGPQKVERIYFTLDGSDPRLPGGSVSPQARLYSAPVAIAQAVPLFARVQRNQRWSSPTIGKIQPGP